MQQLSKLARMKNRNKSDSELIHETSKHKEFRGRHKLLRSRESKIPGKSGLSAGLSEPSSDGWKDWAASFDIPLQPTAESSQSAEQPGEVQVTHTLGADVHTTVGHDRAIVNEDVQPVAEDVLLGAGAADRSDSEQEQHSPEPISRTDEVDNAIILPPPTAEQTRTGTMVHDGGASTRVTTSSPQGINAAVNMEGITFHIGENATVHLHYGAIFGQSQASNEKHVLDTIIQAMTRSLNAEYDMVINTTRGPCTPDTRIVVLNKLVDWCNSEDTSLYWMNGMAGTGKTTLMFSICQLLHKANLLGASFFCSRSLPDCRDITLIIPTIAFQLARQYPVFADALATVLRSDPDILRRGLDVQLRRLIIETWSAKKEILPKHIVIVIDALDECDSDHGKFLQLLFDHIAELPFKILVASRPEFTIRDAIKAGDQGILSTFILHDIEKDLVRADIVRYLESHLSHRTTPDIINAIADLADSLFIYAATVVKLLVSANVNISSRLQTLQNSASTKGKSRMLGALDALYKGVLTIIFSDSLLDDEKEEIQDVLHTILCAREPLTRQGIAELLGLDLDEVNRRLDSLHSIISVSEDVNRPVTILHASLPDFMFDQLRSGSWCCPHLNIHLRIAQQCFAIIDRQLWQNLCQVNGRPPNDSIPSEVIQARISPGLRYGVVYWAQHWKISYESDREVAHKRILGFLSKHLLCWTECLSLVGKLAVSVQALEVVVETIEDPKLSTLAYESLRLIQQTYQVTESCALEVYSSTLTWIPTSSQLFEHYAGYLKQTPRVVSGMATSWPALERVINITSDVTHRDEVKSLAISQDGKKMTFGCGKTVRIWNMYDQIEECILRGHTDTVTSVVISSDRNHVISGSKDRTVRIWKMDTHQAILIINGPSPIWSVSMSSNGLWIASGDRDAVVRIWDAKSGALVHSLKGHTKEATSLSFIPGTTSLVSASEDETARIWDVQTGEMLHVLRGDSRPVLSVACSPEGDKIVTGSVDGSVRVWDTLGKCLQVLRGHESFVPCVAFLPDGKSVVTGSYDRTVRVWNVETREMVNLFTGAGPVSSIAVFSDGQRIASSSGLQIYIWGLTSGRVSDTTDGTEDKPRTVTTIKWMAFSSDGRRVLLIPTLWTLDTTTLEEKSALRFEGDDENYGYGALSASGQKVAVGYGWPYHDKIKVWELTSHGAVTKQFSVRGHTYYINSLTFSSDSDARLLVSASEDCTARVWDTIAGNQLHVLNHPSPLHHSSFSHDTTRIVSCTSRTIHVWDVLSGQQLFQRDIYTRFYSVTFTPDDQHIIAFYGTTRILNSQNGELERIYKDEGYRYWTTFADGSSFAFRDDGWVYRFKSFVDNQQRVVWIPPPYRPSLDFDEVSGPLFTSSQQGIQLCLPRKEGLITLLIPHDY